MKGNIKMDNKEIIKMSAHEINSPIAVIHGYADLIDCGIVKGDNARTMAGKIKKEAKRLSRLVDEMSVFTGIMEGSIYSERVLFEIRDVFQTAIDKARENTRKDFYIEVFGSGSMYGNKELFKILITHIIENAVIYNESEERKILCKISPLEDKLVITIDDNGVGIKEQEREAVFECFYRENKEHSRKLGGNGMGLAICKEIAKAEGMNIFISDSALSGTRVTIEK